MRAALELVDLGVCPYETAHQEQHRLIQVRKEIEDLDYLLLVEHPPVYTFGRKSGDAVEIPGEETVTVERGGEATFHNPGQLVAYPVIRLEEGERDLHLYLRNLEQVIIDLLAEFGISACRREGATGVWIQGKEKKIASIGVSVSSWITYHGVALNVENDLSGFQRINPCGFSAAVMTSMKEELGEKSPSLDVVKERFAIHFAKHFSRAIAV